MSLVATPRRAPLVDRQPLWAAAPSLPFDLKSPTPRPTTAKLLGRSVSHSAALERSNSSKRSRDEEKDTTGTARAKRTRVLSTAATLPPAFPQTTAEGLKAPAPGPAATHPQTQSTTHPQKDRRPPRHSKAERMARDQEIELFKTKYTRAFPSFTFFFHKIETPEKERLTAKVRQLGADVKDFFSSTITHVISNRPRPPLENASKSAGPNKENLNSASRTSTSQPLRSPIQLRTAKAAASTSETQAYDRVVLQSLQFNMKLWESSKLESILARLLSTSHSSPQPATRPTQDLSQLLAVERIQGVTQERDPNARRHDFDYLPKNTYFLLCQDMDEMHPPVALKDFGRWKKGDRPGWPILNIDGICATAGKIPPVFGWRAELEREGLAAPCVKGKAALAPAAASTSRQKKDLRRSISLHNLGRDKLKKQSPTQLRDNSLVSGGASRPSLPSQAYIAASGNSINITSTIASTTSTAPVPNPFHINSNALSKRLRHQVLTSRTFGKAAVNADDDDSLATANDEPPKRHLLKKSKSTNTLRLPPREEAKKPGYCENCRCKFEDFSRHTKSRKHTKFAETDENFATLDDVLLRLERKSLREHQRELRIAEQILSDISDDEDDHDQETAHDDYLEEDFEYCRPMDSEADRLMDEDDF